MIYTSYFAHIKKLDNQYTNLISIARKSPDWFKGREYKKLAPSWDILIQYKNLMPIGREKIYTERFYNEILFPLDLQVNIIIKELGENPVLLCYEKPENFCHRFLVAEWLINKGFEVKEI
jgi:hypothetical protein